MDPFRYAYYALRYGQRRVVVSLVSADLPVPGSHVAVWLGASTPDAKAWIQGGIEQENGDASPSAYVEIGSGGLQVHLERWPVKFGDKVVVALRQSAAGWSCKVGDHTWRGPVVLAGANRISTLETLGGAHAVATLNGRSVSG